MAAQNANKGDKTSSGDVPWEGTRRHLLLIAILTRSTLPTTALPRRAPKGQGAAKLSEGESPSLRVSPPPPPCDSFLPAHPLCVCGLSLLWGWVRSPAVLTRPRAGAQGSEYVEALANL